MIRLFCGYDPRETPGLHVFVHSILKRTSRTVAFIPLAALGMPEGSNAFTLSRFLVPSLCDYQGHAIFCDASDMLSLADIACLDDQFDPAYAVQVVKHPAYTSAHDRKYVGTEMECGQSNYERKNWASVMLINCEHPSWRAVDAHYLQQHEALDVLQLRFLADVEIGELSPQWNILVDEDQDCATAHILHWTAGVPYFWHYRNARRSQDWFREKAEVEGK